MDDQNLYPPDGGPQKTTSREYYLFAFRLIGDFGATIAIPVILLALIGKYFDEKYGTRPLLTILGFVLAATISARIIYKKAKKYGAEYKRMNDAGKTRDKTEDKI